MKIVDTTNSCRTCSHKMYFSGGQYECTKLNKIINDISTIPNWCPLPEYPAQVIQDVENQKAALISKIQALEIELQPGEHYAGIITGKAGELSHHVILLPGDEEGLTLSEAKTWATQAGGCGAEIHGDSMGEVLAKWNKRANAKSQATDAALSRQVACTDGLGAAVPPAPTFGKE